jgi:hypothetical protein
VVEHRPFKAAVVSSILTPVIFPFTVYRSPFTVHRLPFTVYRSPFTVYRSPLFMDLSVNEGTLVVSGGPGDSAETPIVIKKVPRGVSAAGAEHMLLHKWFGEPEKKWTLRRRELLQMNGRTLDVCRVALNDQSERALYFDVTDLLARVRG